MIVAVVGSSSIAVAAYAMVPGYIVGGHIGRVLMEKQWMLESWIVVCGRSRDSVDEPFLLQP